MNHLTVVPPIPARVEDLQTKEQFLEGVKGYNHWKSRLLRDNEIAPKTIKQILDTDAAHIKWHKLGDMFKARMRRECHGIWRTGRGPECICDCKPLKFGERLGDDS